MASPKKNNSLDKCNLFVTPQGDMIEPVYEAEVLEDGQLKLHKVGERNLQQERDAWKDSCDINIIVERFQAGEIDVFSQVQGVYTDITEAPKDLASAYALARNAERTFDRLPIEIKQKYGNSYEKWLSEAGSEDWLLNHGFIQKETVADQNEVNEVKE